MSTIKIYPPTKLPAEGITQTQFNIWKTELEVYLKVESKFRKFMKNGRYNSWTAAEEIEARISTHIAPDTAENLDEIQIELEQFLSIIAKYVHNDLYEPIMRHATSLDWVYNKIREDYSIQQQGIHFLQLLDLKYDPTEETSCMGFYNQYRGIIMGNLLKKRHCRKLEK